MKSGVKQPPAQRAGLQQDHGSTVGRGVDPADRKGRCYGVLQIKYNGVVVNNQKGATRHDAKPT